VAGFRKLAIARQISAAQLCLNDFQRVTPACIADALDESYGVISGAWIEATGRTPLGMTTQELEVQMQGIKRAA
jgi:hypothetical protein